MTDTVPEILRTRIRRLVSTGGERSACAQLRVNRTTLARALGGLPVQVGTIALINQQLAIVEQTEQRHAHAARTALASHPSKGRIPGTTKASQSVV